MFYVLNVLMALAALLSSVLASRRWALLSSFVFAANLLVGVSFFFVMQRPLTLIDAQMLYEASDSTDVLSTLRQFGPLVTKTLAAVALLMTVTHGPEDSSGIGRMFRFLP
jgi:hypothetical protein